MKEKRDYYFVIQILTQLTFIVLKLLKVINWHWALVLILIEINAGLLFLGMIVGSYNLIRNRKKAEEMLNGR